ncbi:hypothetical protein NDU88_005012 [Pleurodeles waltl]|uniref:Uncharacterized protein n=1 Tax=Pleurodeles waltl TaxID=8319 RepID=A0AAV7UIB8_PLEWA|nr:hypothetical protein NDU88_005012 [Pleurodeles waltl]
MESPAPMPFPEPHWRTKGEALRDSQRPVITPRTTGEIEAQKRTVTIIINAARLNLNAGGFEAVIEVEAVR